MAGHMGGVLFTARVYLHYARYFSTALCTDMYLYIEHGALARLKAPLLFVLIQRSLRIRLKGVPSDACGAFSSLIWAEVISYNLYDPSIIPQHKL